jgi:hypothetical protein
MNVGKGRTCREEETEGEGKGMLVGQVSSFFFYADSIHVPETLHSTVPR